MITCELFAERTPEWVSDSSYYFDKFSVPNNFEYFPRYGLENEF